jgi:hypothetical protein
LISRAGGAPAFGAVVEPIALKSNQLCKIFQTATGGRSRLQLCRPHELKQFKSLKVSKQPKQISVNASARVQTQKEI